MKLFNISFLFAIMLVFGLSFASCGNQGKADADATEMEADSTAAGDAMEAMEADTDAEMAEDGPEYTSAYVCPMHCKGSGSAEPGKCPVCGMDYVQNENMNSEEAEGEDGHEGHNH